MRAHSPILILTGAGISQESGLETFRTQGGIWSRYQIEDVATPDAFARNPGLVHEFYNLRRNALADPAIQPNPAHHALVRLEQNWPGPVTIVTQNVDDLHDRAGSRNLIHMHGELSKIRCTACAHVQAWTCDLSQTDPCPSCGQAGGLRPHVVWFGETPLSLDLIAERLEQCALFVSIGTSGAVYPAAGFVQAVRGASLELNLEESQISSLFDESRRGPASLLVPQWVDQMLELVP